MDVIFVIKYIIYVHLEYLEIDFLNIQKCTKTTSSIL